VDPRRRGRGSRRVHPIASPHVQVAGRCANAAGSPPTNPSEGDRMSVLTREALEASPLADLHAIAAELGLDGYRLLRKPELIDRILERQGGEEAAEENGDSEEAEREREARSRRRRGGRRRRRDADEERDEEGEEDEGSEPEAEERAEEKPEDRIVEGVVEL